MGERADSASSSCEEAVYRKRRRSYNAAMSEENSLDEDDDDEPKEEESYPHSDGATRATRCCRRRECNARKISNPESESGWSTESLGSKRTRESSGDIAKSWSEIEIPELLLAHPEILSRMMRCRCFVGQFPACRCRCAQCQYQHRKISSTSSCLAKEPALLLQGVGAKRKDSGNSVSTCQSFLPPSSGRNSAGSLYHYCNDAGDNGTMTMTIQRRHSIAAGPIPHRRYLDQMHSLRNCKIDRADNRRLSEQSLAGDTIRNCESIIGATSIAEPIIASKSRPRASLKTATACATQSLAAFHRDNNKSPSNIKAPKDNESRIGKSLERFTTSGKNAEPNADTACLARKNSAIPITPKMMRRRFSEQLILEGGFGSAGESENLLTQPEDDSLTAINARKKITLKKHYYPEGGWGYVIVIVTILVHVVSHGLQLTSGLLMHPMMTQFQQTVENTGMTYIILLICLKVDR